MKHLLIPPIALVLCSPAHADNATFDLGELPPLPGLGKPYLRDDDANYKYSDPDNPLIKHIEGRRKHEMELKQKQEVAECKAHQKRWRHYGDFEYDWYGWKQTKGTWVTKRNRNYSREDCENRSKV